MRRVEHLITQIRRQTENVQTGITDGITDEEFIQYLNDGQSDIYRAIIRADSRAFTERALIQTQSKVAEYDLPSSMYQFHRIVKVQYSETGRDEEYRNLQRGYHGEITGVESHPTRYILEKNQIILDPKPTTTVTNGLRIFYDPKLPRLDKRRTTVASVTIAAGVVTALTLDTTAPFNVDDYSLDDFLSFVDRDGNTQAAGLPYDSVSAGGVVTITGGGYTLPSGQTITIGDYVTLGENSTTESRLPENNEDYLLAYGAWKIFKRDSSTDSAEQDAERQQMKADIVSNYADANADVTEIAITDLTYWPEEI